MRLERAKEFVVRYEHQLSIGSFIAGFVIDSLVLKRIDLLVSNLVLYGHLTSVLVAMSVLHLIASYPRRFVWLQSAGRWLPFLAQFSFGGMFSGFLIFYSQSGSLWTSWPFLALIVILIAVNEFLRSYQQRLTYQAALLFFCLFSFSIYSLPIFTGSMGDGVFFLSGIAALIAFSVYMFFLFLIGRHRFSGSWRGIAAGVAGIYITISSLYLLNLVPPIPLALKDIGVYHLVERVDGEYQVTAEPEPWYVRFFRRTVTIGPTDSVFVFSSVFAPTALNTAVVHEWQYFDASVDEWITASTISFPISGGRDGGYRGYSEKALVFPAEWRVNVETARGQLIGRVQFLVVRRGSTPALETRILE